MRGLHNLEIDEVRRAKQKQKIPVCWSRVKWQGDTTEAGGRINFDEDVRIECS
jgi:hypothetical protein